MANALDLIDAELSRASQPRASRRPVFLFFREGHKALVRPLVNLDQVLVLSKHSKWSSDPNQKVDAVCASEIGESCWYCNAAKEEKKLRANVYFFLPVWVYAVKDVHTGQSVTYKDEDGQEKPIEGMRVLELSSFGTISSVLKFFRSFYQDEDSGHTITGNDFTLEQSGEGTKKSYIVMAKAQKPMRADIAQAIPTFDELRTLVLAARPPLTADDSPTKSTAKEASNGKIPEF